jgi:class 3 adenylate cyclase
MNLLDVVREVRRHLEENGRLSLRMLRRQFELDDGALEEVIEELVDVQRAARREENALAWSGNAAPSHAAPEALPQPAREPRSYTPKHLADRILTEQAALESRGTAEGERKTITALFADIKGSVELMENLDPEDARAIVDPALALMMDAVHRYEGYVAQARGDGILALFGAPLAHEDHPRRALHAAVRGSTPRSVSFC